MEDDLKLYVLNAAFSYIILMAIKCMYSNSFDQSLSVILIFFNWQKKKELRSGLANFCGFYVALQARVLTFDDA